jgi:hypothetical protein
MTDPGIPMTGARTTTISAWMIAGLKVGVVIPAYDEAASLELLLPRIPGDLCVYVLRSKDFGTVARATSPGAAAWPRAETLTKSDQASQ